MTTNDPRTTPIVESNPLYVWQPYIPSEPPPNEDAKAFGRRRADEDRVRLTAMGRGRLTHGIHDNHLAGWLLTPQGCWTVWRDYKGRGHSYIRPDGHIGVMWADLSTTLDALRDEAALVEQYGMAESTERGIYGVGEARLHWHSAVDGWSGTADRALDADPVHPDHASSNITIVPGLGDGRSAGQQPQAVVDMREHTGLWAVTVVHDSGRVRLVRSGWGDRIDVQMLTRGAEPHATPRKAKRARDIAIASSVNLPVAEDGTITIPPGRLRVGDVMIVGMKGATIRRAATLPEEE